MNGIIVVVSIIIVVVVIITWQIQAFRARLSIRLLTSQLDALKESLSEVVRRNKSILATIDRAILSVDTNLHVVESNALSHSWFGEIEGKTLMEITLSLELVECARNAMQSGALQSTEFVMGSEKRPMSAKCLPSDSGVVCIIEDVVEIKRLESARRDFVANVSHELRTPLASIRAMAETLQSGARKDEAVADRFLNTIVTESDRLTRIAEDLLILSRAESREPERSDFDLSSIVREVGQRFALQAISSNMILEVETEPNLMVYVSRDHIEQAVVNLVDNAIKYTQPGGRIIIRSYKRGDMAVLSVQDTGLGILADDIPRIFERFYRVDKARSRKSGGTGLGLSIVKHVVESNGGTIEVTSEFNHGSTFNIVLPMTQ